MMLSNPEKTKVLDKIPNFKRDDPKIGTIIREGIDGKVVLIGFPYDEGVLRNGGRQGASLAPDCLRRFIPKIGALKNCEMDIDLSNFSVADFGNIVAEDFEACHIKLQEKLKELLSEQNKHVPFVIGGGNDQSWSNGVGFLNYCEVNRFRPLIINIDAHLDVRKLDDQNRIHSGCPFRLLLQDDKYKKLGGRFIEFACQGSQCSSEHVKFVEENNGKLIWMKTIRRSSTAFRTQNRDLITQAGQALEKILAEMGGDERAFVSFDVDSINSAYCPGVSCPSVDGGLSCDEALEIAFISGVCEKVVIMDMSEFNPAIEEDRTARLLSDIFYYFCLGCSTRKQ